MSSKVLPPDDAQPVDARGLAAGARSRRRPRRAAAECAARLRRAASRDRAAVPSSACEKRTPRECAKAKRPAGTAPPPNCSRSSSAWRAPSRNWRDLRARLRREAEADMVQLALAIARRVLRRELAVDPDALHGLVLAALEKLQGAGDLAAYRVHPSHAALRERVPAQIGRRRMPVEVIAGSVARAGRGDLRNRARQPGRLRGFPIAGDRARPGRPPAETTHDRSNLVSRPISPNSTGSRPYALDRAGDRSGRPAGRIARAPAWPSATSARSRTSTGRRIRTQVIGFRNGRVLSMPLEETDGLQLGDPVVARSEDARVEVGPGCSAA